MSIFLAAPKARARHRRAQIALLCAGALLTVLTPSFASAAPERDWVVALRQEVERIDRATPGEIGVYVKRLDTGETMDYRARQRWYLASSAKLPIAVAVLREVEAGRLPAAQELQLKDADRIEGPGNVVWQPTGTRYALGDLLERMLMQSDNTAANMLVRSIGAERLNRHTSALLGDGAGTFTDLAAVRHDVYAELHPSARDLSNVDMVKIAAAPIGPRRVESLRRVLQLKAGDLRVPTMDEAYARYYQRGLNSATLQAYGGMLEQLVRGRQLSPSNTQLLFKHLKFDTYDAYRLEAGLPRSVKFIHKTGTQFERACHMGVIEPQDGGQRAVIVASCTQGMDEDAAAGRAFEQIGRAITKLVLQARTP